MYRTIINTTQRYHYRYWDGDTIKVTQRGDDLAQPSTPTAEAGINVPYGIGTFRIFQPNIIWTGEVTPIEKVTKTKEKVNCTQEAYRFTSNDVIVETTCDELVTTTKTITGYSIQMAMGICLGEEAKLKKILMDGRVVRTEIATKYDNSENTGYSKYTGDFLFMRGDFDQPVLKASTFPASSDAYADLTNWLNAQFGTAYTGYSLLWDKQNEKFILNGISSSDPDLTVSAYPGISYIYFPALDLVALDEGREFSFEIERRPDPLSLGSTNEIGSDINPVTALYDVLTNDWGCMGISASRIDTTTFTAAASILKTEGNGCSFVIAEPTSGIEVLNMLLRQIDGLLYENPATGKIELKLIRFSEFDDEITFALTEANVKRLDSWERNSWAQTFNRLLIKFNNRAKNYRQDTIMAYNFTSEPDSISETRPQEMTFPAVTTKSTASNILSRELAQLSQPRTNVVVTANREAGDLLPGDSVSLNLPRHGVDTFVGVVMKAMRYGLEENIVQLEIRQVVRDDIQVSYGTDDFIEDSTVDIDPDPPTALRVIQAPYYHLAAAGVTNFANTFSSDSRFYPMLFPTAPNDIQVAFNGYISNEPDVGIMEVVPDSIYPTTGLLAAGIDEFDNFSDMIIPSLTVNNVLQELNFMESVGSTGIDAGELMILINDEIMTSAAVTDNGDGSYTFTNVHRMILDTKPGTHASGDKVFIWGNTGQNISTSVENIPAGYTPTFRVLSRVAGGTYGFPFTSGTDAADTEYFQGTGLLDLTYDRLRAPYRPIKTSITTDGLGDGAYGRPTSAADDARIIKGQDVDVSFVTRSRMTPTVSIYADAAEDNEPDYINATYDYVRYKITIRDSSNNEYDGATLTDGADTADSALTSAVPSGPNQGECRLYVKAVNSVGESIWHEELVVIVYDSGWFIDESDTFEFTSEDDTYVFSGE